MKRIQENQMLLNASKIPYLEKKNRIYVKAIVIRRKTSQKSCRNVFK